MWVLLVAGLSTLLGYTNIENEKTRCKQVIVKIDYGKSDTLISQEDIADLLKIKGHSLRGQELGMINFEKIEYDISRQPYVQHTAVYHSLDGVINIDIIQRQPILRIFNKKNESFYLDASGTILPVNPAFSARVLVANGNIDEPFIRNINYLQDTVRLQDSLKYGGTLINLFKLSTFINDDKFLKAQFQQVYVDKTGEFELFPRVGNHIIVFGNTDDIGGKFQKLLIFYKKGLNVTGWNKYQVINIKYKDQVICLTRATK
jgi:cell division protein FtsQ